MERLFGGDFHGRAGLYSFRITGDITTPVLGSALFCAGSMDAFHALAADRLIEAAADNREFIPFTYLEQRPDQHHRPNEEKETVESESAPPGAAARWNS